jgi:hypothetical protein
MYLNLHISGKHYLRLPPKTTDWPATGHETRTQASRQRSLR